jgi:hypothetical protein
VWYGPTLWGLGATPAARDARIMSTHLDPADFARAIVLESADIPANMTIAQWRALKQAAAPSERRGRRAGRRMRRRRRR